MGAPAARVAELSRLWAEEGHEVTVLTGFPNHPTGVVHPEYSGRLRRGVMRENVDGLRVIRTWLLPLPNRRPWERILNYASFCVSAAVCGTFFSRPDVVIATSPQLLVGLSGWWLAVSKRVPFVFEVRDLWPESLAAVDSRKEDSWLYRGLAKLAGFLYRAADRIVVVTPIFKDHLIKRWSVPPEKITVIENGVEAELFHPGHDGLEVRRQLNSDGRLVVAYIGTIGMAHGLETLIDAAEQLESSAPHVAFWIIGEGAEKDPMVALARSRGLKNVQFVDQQPRERIPAYICASDVCLVLLRKNELFKTVLPTKMLEYMACSRPVLMNVDGHAREIVDAAKAGVFVAPGDAPALAKAVMKLAENESLRKALGRNGRSYVLQRFTRRSSAEKYLDLLATLGETPKERSPVAA